VESEAKKEYESKKQERLEKRRSDSNDSKKVRAIKSLMKWSIFLIVLALITWWIIVGVRANIPKGEDFSQAFPSAGRDHIEVGTATSTLENIYTSDPPSSGPHYPNPAKTGFYNEPLEDQFMIHNLEHGDIWIAYNPRVSDTIKVGLENLADRYVIITPRETNEFDISVLAWGRVDSFNLNGTGLPVERIKNFILRYDNEGPEKVRAGGGH
jgi:hypothetical protein